MIYGKDETKGITSINVSGKVTRLYFNTGETKDVDTDLFILWSRSLSPKHLRMHGNLDYKFATTYDDHKRWREVVQNASRRKYDFMTPWNPVENSMIKSGYNNFSGLQVKDVSVLSFDIETTSLRPNSANAKVLIISNTFRDTKGRVHRKLFTYDDYISDTEMINDWCAYVRDINPSIMIGHNIFGFDFPYLKERAGGKLKLGVERQDAIFSSRTREFRKDGSQTYSYHNINIPGREIVDTFFLSIKYDIGRKYESYRLKSIMQYEGLEVDNRQHYDAGTIAQNYRDKAEWVKIKTYAEHDADDALALYDLMIPMFFYYAQHIPKAFQEIINTATGSQINSLMVRSYIQKRHSIPKATKAEGYQGAISFGNPGIYHNVYKVDVASLYPSIMLQYEVYDGDKDPEGHMLKLLQHFTKERLENKQKAKDTKSPYYDALQSAQKIVINSVYGFMGAPGLHFNSPANASVVTKKGRQILERSIEWAKDRGYSMVNADTDSISYTGSKVSIEEDLASLNALYPDNISWEDDGVFEHLLVIKAKNYVMVQNGKVTIKGSGLKATMKEPALKEFIDKLIENIIAGDDASELYNTYAKRIKHLKNISKWCSKKTVTKAVLKPTRTNEARILEAIGDKHVSEGDKIHVFFETDKKVTLLEDFNGVYSKEKLYEKLFKTAKIFENVVDMEQFPNYKLKRNKPLEERL